MTGIVPDQKTVNVIFLDHVLLIKTPFLGAGIQQCKNIDKCHLPNETNSNCGHTDKYNKVNASQMVWQISNGRMGGWYCGEYILFNVVGKASLIK